VVVGQEPEKPESMVGEAVSEQGIVESGNLEEVAADNVAGYEKVPDVLQMTTGQRA